MVQSNRDLSDHLERRKCVIRPRIYVNAAVTSVPSVRDKIARGARSWAFLEVRQAVGGLKSGLKQLGCVIVLRALTCAILQ